MLKSLYVPASIIKIGKRAFHNCVNLSSIKVSKENLKYDSRSDCNAIVESDTNILLHGCSSTTIPPSIIKIGESAFYGCHKLDTIYIPDSVIEIGRLAAREQEKFHSLWRRKLRILERHRSRLQSNCRSNG